MKRKLFFALALFSLATVSYSAEIVKGKIIEHKEWTTGNVIPAFKKIDVDQSKVNPLKINAKGTINQFVKASTKLLPPQIYPVGNMSFIAGNVATSISTLKSAPFQIYTVERGVCTQVNPVNDDPFIQYICSISQDKFALDPGGSFTLTERPGVYRKFDLPGTYEVYVYTSITSEWDVVQFSSDDRMFVSVYR